ncbi:MAG: L-2-amino-thiazoline-4-carboxylic acid hydrolase [Pseudomonadota bacterium]
MHALQRVLAFPLSSSDKRAYNHFRKQLRRPNRADFDRAVLLILEAEKPLCQDVISQSHIVFGSCAVALYRIYCAQGLGQTAALQHMETPITTYGKTSSQFFMWLMRLTSRQPFNAVRTYTIRHMPDRYGALFRFAFEDMQDGFASVVTTCGFRDLLERHGAIELLELFCEWDRVWIEALPPSIRFNRPLTIAKGAKTCRFEFRQE